MKELKMENGELRMENQKPARSSARNRAPWYTIPSMNAFEWASTKNPTEPPAEVYCQTRDVAQARVERIRIMLEKKGWNPEDAASITAIAGELANNSFDHNLGMWKDMPGCWLEVQTQDREVAVSIADRGQGIFSSLRRVRPNLKSHSDALFLAFTEQVTGREPEHRGNGLKFVVRSLNKLSAASFLFQTGNAVLEFTPPVDIKALKSYSKSAKEDVPGVFAKIVFKKV